MIELLAVIVILAIILLIAMPIVLNVISEARKGAFEASARGLIKTVENEYMKNALSGNNETKTYVFEDYEQTEGDLEFSGNGPRNGYIHVTSEGEVAAVLEDGDWLVTKELDEKDITTEELAEQDIEEVFNGIIGTMYTVTYDANEGECIPSSREVTHGDTSVAPSCTRDGYLITDFERTLGSGGELNTETGEVTNVTGNQTIIVNWEEEIVGFVTCGDTLTDERDSEEYATVQIGTQCWMAENLRYTASCLSATWDATAPYNACLPNGGTGWDQNEVLYQWDAAMNGDGEGGQGLCPSGWHFPSDNEWKILEINLGMTSAQANSTGWRGTDQGKQLKSISPGWNGTNLVDFNLKPAGIRGTTGSLFNVGTYGYMWHSTSFSSTHAWYRYLWIDYDRIHRGNGGKAYGKSVRCVLDV